jgi:hypothetical protein
MTIAAWVPIGMLVDFAQAPREPVLDVVAGSDFPEVLATAKLRTPRLQRDRCSRLVRGAPKPTITSTARPSHWPASSCPSSIVHSRADC